VSDVSLISVVETAFAEASMPVPRCADILRCLHCGSTWSLLMDAVVSSAYITMTLAPVSPDRVDDLGAGVAWYGCDDCKLCKKDRKEPNWDELRESLEKLPDAGLRVELEQMLEDRRRRFR
jgi:hypothetical protein